MSFVSVSPIDLAMDDIQLRQADNVLSTVTDVIGQSVKR